MNLILCGLPMSGKTTIGKRLAKQLNWPFVDLDERIEQAYFALTGQQLLCRQICQFEGEPMFRRLEKEQMSALQCAKNHVIALGGGTLSDDDSKTLIQQMGEIIYLKASAEMIWRRLELHEIPSYLDQNHPKTHFYAIANQRMPIFEQVSDHIIETSQLSEELVVDQIIEYLSLESEESIYNGE